MNVSYPDMQTTADVNSHVHDEPDRKDFSSPDYNYTFCKKTGYFERWGRTRDDDPDYAPAPEILDLEISVNGCPKIAGESCRFCYKGNTAGEPTNMSFDTFREIFDKMSTALTQIAFGITGVQTNPDFLRMMHYTRERGVIPNFTLSGADLTDRLAEECAEVVGALAVSAYERDRDLCYNTVQKFVSLGIDQTNIHLLVSKETMPFVMQVVRDRLKDPRLQEMGSIVFLGVKPKGRARDNFHPITKEGYKVLVGLCLAAGIRFGFDSCSEPKYEHAVKSFPFPDNAKRMLIECAESCESSLMSSYISCDSKYWHCSFAENEDGQRCVDVLDAEDFVRDVWNSPEVVEFRERSVESGVGGCRYCTVFPEINV